MQQMYPIEFPESMSFSPIITPPITMPATQTFWKELLRLGRPSMQEIPITNKTISFLNDKKAPRGMIVRQYDERRVLAHIQTEKGITLMNLRIVNWVEPTKKKATIMTIR